MNMKDDDEKTLIFVVGRGFRGTGAKLPGILKGLDKMGGMW